jgi:hypothetical protein
VKWRQGRRRKDADQVFHGECQNLAGKSVDQAIGELLVDAVNPLALEVTLAVQQELEARWEERIVFAELRLTAPGMRPS